MEALSSVGYRLCMGIGVSLGVVTDTRHNHYKLHISKPYGNSVFNKNLDIQLVRVRFFWNNLYKVH